MFYFVSEDGKRDVRNAVGRLVARYLENGGFDDEDMLSLAMVGHSACAVVAFYVLFYLFDMQWKDAGGFAQEMVPLSQWAKEATLRVLRRCRRACSRPVRLGN